MGDARDPERDLLRAARRHRLEPAASGVSAEEHRLALRRTVGYSLAKQATIDRTHGLIRTWDASAANAHDGARLPDVVSKGNTGSGVWADTAYRSKKNEAFLARACSPATSIRRSRRAGRYLSASPGPMPSDRRCARRSSTCSLAKSTAWGSSCAPSVSREPASKSEWRTWPITSSVLPGLRGVQRPHDAKTGPCSRLRRGNQRINHETGALHPLARLHVVIMSKSDGSSRCPTGCPDRGAGSTNRSWSSGSDVAAVPRHRRSVSEALAVNVDDLHLNRSRPQVRRPAAWLGHSQVATTHRYAAADVEMMRRGLNQAAISGKQPARFRAKGRVLQLLESL